MTMVDSSKYQMVFCVCCVVFCANYGIVSSGPVTELSQDNHVYLPPAIDSPLNEEGLKRSSSMVNIRRQFPSLTSHSTTSYKTDHNSPNNQRSDSQTLKYKPASSQRRLYHNSYAPQPSGVGTSLPQPPTAAPLPSLNQNSVLKQLISASASTFPSSSNSAEYEQTLALFPSLKKSKIDATKDHDPKETFSSASVVMINMTPSQNQTVYLAKLLASSLLHATGLERLEQFMDSNGIKKNQMNSTDVMLLRAEKNAYIVPYGKNPMAIEELYNMRDELQKAYTVTQFVFIIRPEHINFLNKLV